MNSTYQLALLDQALNRTRSEIISDNATRALNQLSRDAKSAAAKMKKGKIQYAWQRDMVKFLETL